jgi:hypothetical protein
MTGRQGNLYSLCTNKLAGRPANLYKLAPMSAVDQLIDAFGGIRAAQRKLGEKHASTLQSWQKTGSIPHFRAHQIRGAAAEHGVRLPAKLMAALFPPQDNKAA